MIWSLVFGNGDPDKPLTTLLYTAGFADQTDGVFSKGAFIRHGDAPLNSGASPVPSVPTVAATHLLNL
jgi:hypothetical protein